MTATKANKIDEITEQLEQGVKNVFESAEYKAYLEFVSKFYDYSINNVFLIFMQMPAATHVAGFKAWQDKFKRHVKKGEKGIKILAPCPHKVKKEVEDENGNKAEKEIQYTTYRALDCSTIDIVERKIGRKRFDIMCDDEGLFKDPQKISAIDNLGRPMLVGNLMFFNNDGAGNLTELSDNDISYIMKRIIHMYTHQYPKGYKMLTQCEY